MRFYIQVDADNVVHDCIMFPHGDYVPVEISTPLPDGFIGGWYRWKDGAPVYDRNLFEQVNELSQLRERAGWADELELYAFEQAYQVALLTISGGGE